MKCSIKSYHRIREEEDRCLKRIFHRHHDHDRYRGIVHFLDWKRKYHRTVPMDWSWPGKYSEVQLVERTDNHGKDMCCIGVR